MSTIDIFNVNFHEQGIDVVYAEERDVDPTGQVVVQRSIMIAANLIPDELREMMDAIQEAVDKALTAKDSMQRRPAPMKRRSVDE